jgi:hypothetical protein
MYLLKENIKNRVKTLDELLKYIQSFWFWLQKPSKLREVDLFICDISGDSVACTVMYDFWSHYQEICSNNLHWILKKNYLRIRCSLVGWGSPAQSNIGPIKKYVQTIPSEGGVSSFYLFIHIFFNHSYIFIVFIIKTNVFYRSKYLFNFIQTFFFLFSNWR